MIKLLLASAVIALIASVLLTPLITKKREEGKSKKVIGYFFIGTFILGFLATGITLYVTKIDVNWLVFWPAIIVLTLAGAFLASGIERKIKGILFLASLVVAGYVLSAPLWNADDKYQSAEMKAEVEIKPFDETQTPASVPPKFVRNKMKKAFGQVPNTSYYELGRLQIQKVDGKYVYIAPVEFSGFFKWMNGDTTPGYFTMSATDSTDNPKFVAQEMKYVPSAYLNKNLERHMRLQHPFLIYYGDVQLEVDDDGKPYYIRSYGEFISARNGFDVQGIVLVDALSGKTEVIKLADVPEFIDGAVSPETVSLQNSYYGKYVHGYWNSLFGKKDVKLPSDEGTESNVSPIFNENGEMYYFTDFTSPKEGVDSMLGYSLTNARTGQATYYTGNRDASYMDSQGALQIIEKKFIEKKWTGEMPVLYNFYGEASWLTAVLDANGFLQNYFIVSAANPEISAYATTPKEALKLYKTALSRGSSTVEGSSSAEEKNVSGKVQRVYKERLGDFTVVSFLLDNGKNYLVSAETEPLSIYLQVGDEVLVTYGDTGEQFLPVRTLIIKGLQ
ncbi:membrane protein [Lysinibacillus contaminans]|uniref:Membrane protein n=1 Tax=Lysinibacillus contaminans TaxID=1293441 RepID=A0ABR5JW81_9BACI|nr:tripartite tricarboxylate transporter TctB family protein [Lysinibacillus contaminans]KOS66420.1 membrane protein [Lysinibacillus contaminans]